MAKLVDYQPFKALYLTYFVSSLAFKAPVWFIRYLSRARRPRSGWTLKRAMIVRTLQELFSLRLSPGRSKRDPLAEVPDSKLVDAKFVWVEPVSDEYVVGEVGQLAEKTGVTPAKIAGYWLLKKGSSWAGPKAKPGEKTVLHMHGGAFYIGTGNPSDITANFTRGLLEHSAALERIFAVDYRLTASAPHPPANPFPAALLDALAAYRYLVHDAGFAPANIVLAGDSAGGNLAVVLALYLVHNPLPGLPPPARVLAVSPWLDLSMSRRGPESSTVANAPTDMFGRQAQVQAAEQPEQVFGRYGVAGIQGPLGFDVVQTCPYISPVSLACAAAAEGLWKGFPESYVIAGGAERLLDDAKALLEGLRAAGVAVTEDIPPDAIHDFVVMRWHEPERTEALQRASKWIDAM